MEAVIIIGATMISVPLVMITIILFGIAANN